MSIHTTPIHGLQAPNGDDPRDNGDDLLRALVDQLDILLPRMGDIKPSFQTVDHSAWLLADGRNTLLRSAYSPAFVSMMLAAGYNGSDGTHFGVPDWRGNAIVGADPGGVKLPINHPALGAAGGEERHALSVAELAAHSHPLSLNLKDGGVLGANDLSDQAARMYGGESSTEPYPDNYATDIGGNQPHNNLQPFRTANIFIFTG